MYQTSTAPVPFRLSRRSVNRLLGAIVELENDAPTPERRKYWDAQYRRLSRLARRIGWIY